MKNEYSQEEILDLYFARDQKAVVLTSEKFGGKLLRFAENMINREDAMECLNDTYMTAWSKIPPERPDNFLAWLFKVLRNTVCDRIDWNNAGKRKAGVTSMLDELAECIPDTKAAYDGELSDLGRSLSEFLRKLDKEKRVLFVRRYWYGVSISELARETGMTESNVKTSLFRIRGKLKEYLLEEGVYYDGKGSV